MKQLFIHSLLFILFIYAFLFGYQTISVKDPESHAPKIVQQQNPPRTKAEISNNPFDRFPNSVIASKAIKEGEVIYNVDYEIDGDLCRKSVTTNPNATKHALFSGDVYGVGISGNETLSYFFQKKTSEFEEHNLGFSDGGIQMVLKHQELYKWQDMMDQKNGYFFYFYHNNHLEEFTLSLRFISKTRKGYPVYHVKNDTLIPAGTIGDQKEFQNIELARKVFLSKLYVNFYEEPFNEDEAIRNYTTAILEAKKRYSVLYPNGEFIFVFHPMAMSGKSKDTFYQYLKEKKIRVLDAEEVFKKMLEETHTREAAWQIPGDIHPNAKLNEWLADWLIKEMVPKPVDQVPTTNPDGTMTTSPAFGAPANPDQAPNTVPAQTTMPTQTPVPAPTQPTTTP
jgi:hypothetical protein